MHRTDQEIDAFADTVIDVWGLPATSPAGPGNRLHGGQEAAVFRVGEYVIRVAAPWRTEEDLTWCCDLATAVARSVPEVVTPVPNREGKAVARINGRLVTVWPYVHGQRGDDRDEHQRAQAADLLARTHRALAELAPPAQPERPTPAAPVAELADPDLDAWLRRFRRSARPQPVHGDFYAANVLVDGDRSIVALIDWDDAGLSSAEWELAGAAWEWGDGQSTLDLTEAHRFLARYQEAGGTAGALDDLALRQLVRARIRDEVAYDRATESTRVVDEEDAAYQARQLEAFRVLRPR